MPVILDELALTLDGLRLLNDTEVMDWETVTSDHIKSYWDGLPHLGIVVSDVITTVTRQIDSSNSGNGNRNRRELVSTTNGHDGAGSSDRILQSVPTSASGQTSTPPSTTIVYNQEIRYGVVFDSTISRNLDILFHRPFEADSQRYINALLQTLFPTSPEPPVDVVLGGVGVLVVPTPAPTRTPTSMPTPFPTTLTRNSNNNSNNTVTIVVVVVLVVLVLVVVLVIGYYLTSRQGGGESYFLGSKGPSQSVLEDEESMPDVVQPRPSGGGAALYSYDDGNVDLDPYGVGPPSRFAEPGSLYGVPTEIVGGEPQDNLTNNSINNTSMNNDNAPRGIMLPPINIPPSKDDELIDLAARTGVDDAFLPAPQIPPMHGSSPLPLSSEESDEDDEYSKEPS